MAVAPTILRGSLLLLAFALPAGAQDTLHLETLSGKKVSGQVLEDDGKTVRFQTVAGVTMDLAVDLLTPMSRYALRRADVARDDAEGLLALAEWCVPETLYMQARANYRAALEADPKLSDTINKSLIKARTTAAKEIVARAKRLQQEGKDGEARALLTQLVQELPLEPASQEAARMLAADKAERQEQAATVRGGDAEGARSEGRRFSDEAYEMFEKTIKAYTKALDDNHDGLTEDGSSAVKKFQKALDELAKARKETQKAVDKGSHQPPDLDAALAEIDLKIGELDTDLRLSLCNAYIMRSSYKQAADTVNAGLAMDPKNQRLLAARDRVAMASSNEDNGWVIRR